MIHSLSIRPCTLLNDCSHTASAIFWRSAIHPYLVWVLAYWDIVEKVGSMLDVY